MTSHFTSPPNPPPPPPSQTADYCNSLCPLSLDIVSPTSSLLCGQLSKPLNKLQLVQNSAAHLFTYACQHIHVICPPTSALAPHQTQCRLQNPSPHLRISPSQNSLPPHRPAPAPLPRCQPQIYQCSPSPPLQTHIFMIASNGLMSLMCFFFIYTCKLSLSTQKAWYKKKQLFCYHIYKFSEKGWVLKSNGKVTLTFFLTMSLCVDCSRFGCAGLLRESSHTLIGKLKPRFPKINKQIKMYLHGSFTFPQHLQPTVTW